MQANGEFYFRSGDRQAETPRELVVETLETAASPRKTPSVTSNVTSLDISEPEVTERPHVAKPNWISRYYTYKIRLGARTGTEAFAGRLLVSDPWNDARVLALNVHGEECRPLQVVPARLTLFVKDAWHPAARVRFLARDRRGKGAVRVEMEGSGTDLLRVSPTGSVDEDGFVVFEVRWKGEPPAQEGVHNITVQSENDRSTTQVVPLKVMVNR